MRSIVAIVCLTACSGGVELDGRQQRIVNTLYEDNYMWARRDPVLTAMKLHKMQRGPYEWMRGTAALYWRDINDPGADRPTTTFGSPESSRVLLVGDPHPENAGTFGTDTLMTIDWNDFDASGYGPFTGDLRRLGAGLAIAVGDPAIAEMMVRRAVTTYDKGVLGILVGGPVAAGSAQLFADELAKAKERGDAHFAVNELAPVVDGARVLAVGDLEPVADDGVIEDRVVEVAVEEAAWIDAAVAQMEHRPAGAIKFRARRIGSGVSSYAALRYNVIFEGETVAPDDDRIIELKETRDGIIIDGQPRFAAAEWDSPAARVVDTQRRLQSGSGDVLLGSARVGALSLKIRDREAYQRGINREDITALVSNRQKDIDDLGRIADAYGQMLAQAHRSGAEVIKPLLIGREDEFIDELTRLSLADAAQIVDDYTRMSGLDLAALVLPQESP